MSHDIFTLTNACTTLFASRKNWEGVELAASNKRLYGILAECYDLYTTVTLTESGRKLLTQVAEELGISVERSTPAAIKMIKIVFGAEPRWRASNYGQVLRIAEAEKVKTTEFVSWLEKNGGVENVRRGTTPVPQATKDKQFADGLAKLNGQGEYATLEPTRTIASGSGLYLMLCTVEANGAIKVHRPVGNPNSDQIKAIVRAIGKENDNAKSLTDPDGIFPNQFSCFDEGAVNRKERFFNSEEGEMSYEDAVNKLIGGGAAADDAAGREAA
jgi:hypothetical protein